MDGWVIALVIVACLVAGAVLCAIWWWIPKLQMHGLNIEDPKDRASVEDNFRKTVGQVIGGSAVLVGAALAYLQFSQQQETAAKEALRQQDASARQLIAQQKASEDSIRASQALLISNQVAKGFEQLGSDKVAVRLGGIYALEGEMNTSEQYRVPVLEALCAFLRDVTPDRPQNQDRAPSDIQAVLTVIGRRKDGPGLVFLSGADIGRTILVKANLSGAYFIGANLSVANMSDVNLSGAHLGIANLSRAA